MQNEWKEANRRGDIAIDSQQQDLIEFAAALKEAKDLVARRLCDIEQVKLDSRIAQVILEYWDCQQIAIDGSQLARFLKP
jgi:hypothetical protein